MSQVENRMDSGRQPRRLPILLWVSLGIFALVPVVRWCLFETDHQFANMGGTATVMLGCLVAYVSLWYHFAIGARRKAFFLAAPLAIATIGWSLFEFTGVTGELIPIFRTRLWLKRLVSNSNIVPSSASQTVPIRESAPIPFESTQFLGPDRNGIVQNQEFSVAWDEQLPKVVWKIPIGAGWSGFAISRELAITLEQIDEQECLTAFELKTGKVAWRVKSPGRHSHPLGGLGPRSTPTIHRGKVIAQSALGIVSCVELETGALLWQQDLLKLAGIDQETSEKAILWGRSGSPLVFENSVVVPFGGKADSPSLKSLIAFDLETGQEIWTGGDQQISYASPVLLTLCGVQQIVGVNEGSVTGHDPKKGSVLWSTPWPSKSNGDACSSQPVAVDDRRLLLGKGYALGSKMIELNCSGHNSENEPDSASWKVDTNWESTRNLKTKFTSAIAYQGYLYGLSDGVLECIDPKDGSRVWRGKRFGHGQSIIVNGHILVTTEDGRVVLIPATPSGQGREIAQMPVLDGVTWNIPAVAGPYLLIRNAEFAACLVSNKDAGHDAGSVPQ